MTSIKVKSLIKKTIPQKNYSLFREQYLKLKYFGTKFTCPFCKGIFRTFLPFGVKNPIFEEKNIIGGGYRLNVMCPCCNSTDRERNIYLYLKNKTNIFNEDITLLHVAPESNLKKVFINCSTIHYLTVDLKSTSVMAKMDLTNIACIDNSFDVIICNHVFEHIPNDRKAISELYKVLKRGGWAILQVPISQSLTATYEDPSITGQEEREKIFGQKDHVRIYAKDYIKKLQNAGFSVEIYNYAIEHGENASKKYGLLKEEDIYICSKKR